MSEAPILVSACLAGQPCRYDGTACPHPAVVALVELGRALVVCPEVLGGLPTPRGAVEIREGRFVTRSGADVTEAFQAGARKCLEIAQAAGCREAILKARSPSCGCGVIYDGSFTGTLIPGDGVCAALLKRHGISVRTESDL